MAAFVGGQNAAANAAVESDHAERYTHLRNVLGDDVFAGVRAAKLLVVGAGGIGCELLKNLVLSGFRDIETIDLDTIDVSNLNRQFLFRPEHVGQPKAVVAKEAVQSACFNPDPAVNIVAYHGNIKDPKFGLSYFKQFTIVLNALDNLSARRHVNRLCLAANIPLIDAGTTGYLGQVTVIQKGNTECYDCTQKSGQKVYPICTIRSTPDKPVHCIVWAKELHKLLFGVRSESMLHEELVGPDGKRSVFMDAVNAHPGDAKDATRAYAKQVFDAIFFAEIEKKLAMKDRYKTAKHKPQALSLARVETMREGANAAAAAGSGGSSSTAAATALPDQRVPTLPECADNFIQSVMNMWSSSNTAGNSGSGGGRREEIGNAVFDKDDDLALDFVAAAANLRAHIFGIPLQSRFDTKSIAGNIIPAIATTNAIVAGIQVLEAWKIIRAMCTQQKNNNTTGEVAGPVAADTASGADDNTLDCSKACCTTYLARTPNQNGKVLMPSPLYPPNPKCYVCASAKLHLATDVNVFTLEDLVAKVLKAKLGFNEPCIYVGDSGVYEEGEDCDEGLKTNLLKTLKDLPAGGVQDGSMLKVEDFSQNLECDILVAHRDKKTFDELKTPEFFEISGDAPQNKPVGDDDGTTGNDGGSNGDDDDGSDLEIIEAMEAEDDTNSASSSSGTSSTISTTTTTTNKRKRVDSDPKSSPGSQSAQGQQDDDTRVAGSMGDSKRVRLNGSIDDSEDSVEIIDMTD